MKKIICTAVSALALAAFADGVNSTEFGALHVPSNDKETIVAVPWLESGTGSSDVSITNLVLTAGLHEDDILSLYDGATLVASWKFQEGRWVGQSPITTIPRGKALMLKRPTPGTTGFYIMGKPATLSAQESTLTLQGGTFASPAYSLIAPPSVSGVSPNSLAWTNLKAGSDKLIIGGSDAQGAAVFTILTWKGDTNKWGTAGDTELKDGTGMWFKSGDSSLSPKTVSWEAK